MSIIISNMSKKYSRTGLQNYVVQLNSINLCDVEHISEDGMSALLRKCADALDDVNIDDKIREHKYKLFAEILRENGY